MNYMDSFEWLLCPVCNSKTRIKLRLDTELKNFPLFCPKCKQETLISVHLLARFTSYVNVKMGNPSQFDVYVDRERKGNTFDIEHILPDDYSSYQDEFVDADDFQARIFLAVTIAKNLLWLREGAGVIFSLFGGYLSRFSFLRPTKNLKNRPPVALKIHQSNHLTTKHPKTTLNAQN